MSHQPSRVTCLFTGLGLVLAAVAGMAAPAGAPTGGPPAAQQVVGRDLPAGEVPAARPVAAPPVLLAGAAGRAGIPQSAAVSATSAPYEHRVTVVRAGYAGKPARLAAADTLLRASLAQSNDYWFRQTRGKVTFLQAGTTRTTDASTSLTDCDMGHLRDVVAKAVGWTDADRRVLLIVTPTVACLGAAGLTMMPSSALRGSSSVWLLGPSDYAVLSHELGHTIGLGHSNEQSCKTSHGPTVDGGTCIVRAYANTYNTMGLSFGPWIGAVDANMALQSQLWRAGEQVTVAPRPGQHATVTLIPIGSSASGLRAVSFLIGTRRYTVEYRAATGVDAWIGHNLCVKEGCYLNRMEAGVFIVKDYPGHPNESVLIDAQPTSNPGITGDVFKAQASYDGRAQIGLHHTALLAKGWKVAVSSQTSSQATVVITAP